MRLKTLTALLGILAGAAGLASCAHDTAHLSQAEEGGDWRPQANSCSEKAVSAEEMEMLVELASEKRMAEKFKQARAQHQDVMTALAEHVAELNANHALPGAANGDEHGHMTLFPAPAIEKTALGGGSSLWSDATCDRVYVVKTCFKSGNYLRHRFCSENVGFKLLSTEKWAGSEWVQQP